MSTTALTNGHGNATSVGPSGRPLARALAGRPFVGAAFDHLVIGGGLSLVVLAVVVARPEGSAAVLSVGLAWGVFLSNSAHFASSTVRLYTKPGAFTDFPFLTAVLPILSIGVLVACLAFPQMLGANLIKLYLTWSPYHYAAQAYGLATVYSYRAGCILVPAEKRVLWWVAMLPALYAVLVGNGLGVQWLAPAGWLDGPVPSALLRGAGLILPTLGFAAPLAFVAWLWSRPSGPPPVIAPLILLTNAAWWFVLSPLQAFAWATIFHGLQYLAIVAIFHAKDRAARAEGRVPAWKHVLPFYLTCVAFGWLLFNVLPHAGTAMGFGMVESVLVVTAAINVHHFIVDAYIWRLGRNDGNRRIVDAPPVASASAEATA